MKFAALQTAIHARLSHSSVTSLLGTGGIRNEWQRQVLDSADAAPFPFITVTYPGSAPFDTKDEIGLDARVQVDVWARDDSLAIKTIADAVYSRLHRGDLEIDGHITTEAEEAQFLRDPDGITRRALLRFRVVVL